MDKDFQIDVSHFPKELTLLLSLMSTKNGEGLPSNNSEYVKDMDWSLFLKLARHHRIYPVLYRKLQEIDESWIPQNIIQSLHHDYQKNTFQMLKFSAEMEHLCTLFSKSNIRSLVLKGPVLGSDLYGDISLRTSGDLDILIPIQDLDVVEELLIKLGYVKDEYIQAILNDWKWRHHHITFFHLKKGIKIEVHWRLNPGPGKEPGFNELWERRRISKITSNPVSYLGREDLFLFLVSHGARHGWSRLRWLADIDQISKQNLNISSLRHLLKKYQLLHIGAQALILTSQLFQTPLTEEMKSIAVKMRPMRLAKDAIFYIHQMVNLHNEPIPEDVAIYHKRHLFSLMSHQQKMLFIMSFLYPYPEDAATLTLPKRFHFLYFPLRPILWVWRKMKKQVLKKENIL
ncbi:nucleotidyltransferase domain-containing protein [Paenibacillus sp. sgz302251]|uniref:nucleotidyltransferase domain-containing protein n=1 Tax=Paenibacillus sp. sgz302251 TaxID=3414493 RepID=UPI003C7E788D